MKLTKRGKRVRALVILIGVYLMYQVIINLWWTGSDYCWGSMLECVPPIGAN